LILHNIFLFQCPCILALFGWFSFMSFFCYFCVLCLSFIYVFVGDSIASTFIIGDHNVFPVFCIMLLIEIMQEFFFKALSHNRHFISNLKIKIQSNFSRQCMFFFLLFCMNIVCILLWTFYFMIWVIGWNPQTPPSFPNFY
jgi:hypothetical protein